MTRILLVLVLIGGAAGADEPDLFAPRPETPLYSSGGRRDPFVPLKGSTAPQRTCPLPGLGAVPVEAAALRGIVETRGGRIALLAAPDGRTHFARIGERLCDGELVAIDADAVAFRQEVLDPLSPERSRAVKRLLHP